MTPGALSVGAPVSGERLQPLGFSGRRPLVRLLQEARVPVSRRRGWPVVRRGTEVIWLPGVCRSAAAVPAIDREAVHLLFEPNSMTVPPDALRRTGRRRHQACRLRRRRPSPRACRRWGARSPAAYPAGDLLLLGLLKGSFIFMADLARAIERPLQVDFMVASSYGKGTTSSGNVRLLYDPATDLAGKHVLVVEDIIDTGRTLQRLLSLLSARQPASLAVCALLDKKIAPPDSGGALRRVRLPACLHRGVWAGSRRELPAPAIRRGVGVEERRAADGRLGTSGRERLVAQPNWIGYHFKWLRLFVLGYCRRGGPSGISAPVVHYRGSYWSLPSIWQVFVSRSWWT